MPPKHIPHAAALTALLAAPVSAEPMTLIDYFSVDRLANMGATWMVTSLRSFAKITYVDMNVEALEGRMALTGLEIYPYETPAGVQCAVTIDRAVLTTAPMDQFDFAAIDADLVGLTVSPGCLEPDAAEAMMQFGIDNIRLDRADLRFDYDHATGGGTFDIHAISSELADIRAEMVFDYIAVDADSEEPVADLASAEIDIVDQGLFNRFAPLIPPEARDPEALAMMLKAILIAPPEMPQTELSPGKTEGTDDTVTLERPATPAPGTADAEAFLDGAAGELAGFVSSPGRLRLWLRPESPVRLADDIVEDFASFAALFRPELASGDLPLVSRMTGADLDKLQVWVDTGEGVSEAEALDAARAFLTGVGVPRDRDSGVAVLVALLNADNTEAVDLALDHVDALDPATAYDIAWQAAAKGHKGAFAHLDRLERALPLNTFAGLQDRVRAPRDGLAKAPARELQERAVASLTGLGAPRNYADAYFFALLAAAAGDRSAPALIDQIEAMGDRFEGEEAELWTNGLAGLRGEASDLWFGRGQ